MFLMRCYATWYAIVDVRTVLSVHVLYCCTYTICAYDGYTQVVGGAQTRIYTCILVHVRVLTTTEYEYW